MSAPLQLWGGYECTVNRIGNRYFDQSVLSRHDDRPDDIARFAELGIAKLRYPVLWERVSPVDPDMRDYHLSDRDLDSLRACAVSPIIGLLHHGSGPVYTDLLDPHFAHGLAMHARHTAERYPDVIDWTPINEPLTTARFSMLYGHWYPHCSDERQFWLALLNQIDAIMLSMIAIKRVNSGARLVQTEDFGKTYATDPMAGQAEFDNVRRWLTWDLLSGRVTSDHPFWERLVRFGLGDRLRAIADMPCPPAVLGVNHYLTSDRFLDHRIGRYPRDKRGRNSCGAVADLEAVRVLDPRQGGLENALGEVWERYRLPIAITEVHNGCTREEQMRWTLDAWQVAQRLRADGIDIKAMTAWSLLGAFHWNSLLTKPDGSYECGVFDIRADPPRTTAMVPLLRALSGQDAELHPVLARPGWWHGPGRLQYPGVALRDATPIAQNVPLRGARPILITGATGMLGKAFAEECRRRAIPYILTGRHQLPLTDAATIDRLLTEIKPWAVINGAGWQEVDKAELEEEACFSANRDGTMILAGCCVDHGIPFTTFSSDLVFDGTAGRPYIESDRPIPLNIFGRSKASADTELTTWHASILVIRTAALFSPHDSRNFATCLISTLGLGQRFRAADCTISPTLVADLTRTTLDLIIDGAVGLWHLSNFGSITWAQFARELARAAHLPAALVVETARSDMGWLATRPAFSALTTSRGQILPTLHSAIGSFMAGMRA